MAPSNLMALTKRQLVEEVERLGRKLAEYEAGPPQNAQPSPLISSSGGQVGAPDADGARFRTLINNALDSFVMVNIDGRLREVNDSYVNLIGYSRDELLSMSIADLEAVETPEEIQQHIAQIIHDGPVRFETQHRRKDGSLIDFEANVQYFADSSAGFYCFMRDITERRRTENWLQLGQYALDHTSEAIVWANPEGRIVYANDAASRISHVPSGSMTGRRLWEFNKNLTEAQWRERWERVKEKGSEKLELTVTGPDGEISYIEAVVGYVAFGDIELYVSFGRDITERKQMESALLRANDKFSKVFRTSPIGISISTVSDGRYIDVNDAFVTMYGFNNREEIIGKTSASLNTWANIEERQAIMENTRTKPLTGTFYYQFRHQSGEVRDALCAYDLFDLDGEECVMSMFQDVTERKQTEDALRESEEKYRQVFSTVSDAILLIDVNTRRLIDVNDGAVRMYGYTRAEMLEMRLDDITGQPHDLEALMKEIVAGGRARIPVRDHKRKDGAVFPGEISADLAALRGREVLVKVVRDITERRRAEEALRENEETLRTLVKVLPMGVALVNPAGQIVQMNPALERISGLTKEELIKGTYLSRRYLLGDGTLLPPGAFPSQRAVAEGRTIQDVEIGVIKEDGVLVWTSISSAPLPDGSVVTVSADITERKLAEAQLAQYHEHLEELVERRTAQLSAANEHLAALSRVKDEFVSNVSHELRTPIASLKLFVDLLKLRPEKRDAYQQHIERELKRLELMVEDLLRLSRLDSEQVPLALSEADMNQLVAQMVADRQSLAEKIGLALNASLAPEPLPAVVDQGLIGQALSVLLTNAFNYTPRGGQVIVRTRRRRADDRVWVGFSVSDTGPGFPPEDKERLFTRFFRGKAGRASGAAGTGLGLAIAKEIVDRHEGRIEAESGGVSGEGAQFSIWLPARGEQSESG